MNLDKFFEEISDKEPSGCSYVIQEPPKDIYAPRCCINEATHKTRRVFVKTQQFPDIRSDGKVIGTTDHDLYLPDDSYNSKALTVCEEHRVPMLEMWYDKIE